MRKITALFLSAAMLLGLAACGSSQSTAQNNSAQSAESAGSSAVGSGESASSSAAETTTADGEKTLVVYYSASGHTEAVANDIADATGGDLFELVPQEQYSDEDLDWTQDDSRVVQEYEDESLRDIPLVEDTVENWDEYDTVFIGYPIWWGIAAWPVNNFVENNDFTGKTVIPFCTSASSGMGDSGTLLEEMAGTGDWQEGQRFASSASSDEVIEWVDGLGL